MVHDFDQVKLLISYVCCFFNKEAFSPFCCLPLYSLHGLIEFRFVLSFMPFYCNQIPSPHTISCGLIIGTRESFVSAKENEFYTD